MTGRRVGLLIAGLLAAGSLVACSDSSRNPSVQAEPAQTRASPTGTATPTSAAAGKGPVGGSAAAAVTKAKPVALRAGERRSMLRMPESYAPAAPYGEGTDDYRCFVLDPRLDQDAWLTGTDVQPGTPSEVHHVILFRISPENAEAAREKDASEPGQGWTCFGGSGIAGEFDDLDDASWLGAWAPGSGESVLHRGYGVPLAKGSLIVMQVHYNLLAGDKPDRSATRLRWVPQATASADHMQALHTVLLPAPVELPCRPDHDTSPLCDRDASVADNQARFGDGVGQTANLLHLLCGTGVTPGDTTTCTRTVPRGMTVIGTAGHMHLLGRSISIVADQGTAKQTSLLDIGVWDFDNQGAHPITPVHLDAGDTVTVTCRYDQSLRDQLPALAGIGDKYVVWGEGTTDEMCLGMLQVAFDPS